MQRIKPNSNICWNGWWNGGVLLAIYNQMFLLQSYIFVTFINFTTIKKTWSLSKTFAETPLTENHEPRLFCDTNNEDMHVVAYHTVIFLVRFFLSYNCARCACSRFTTTHWLVIEVFFLQVLRCFSHVVNSLPFFQFDKAKFIFKSLKYSVACYLVISHLQSLNVFGKKATFLLACCICLTLPQSLIGLLL